MFKDFFTCRNILVSNNQQPGNIQRLFRLQNCLSRRSSITRKYSKTSSPAEKSQPQIIHTPKIFIDFFACKIVLAVGHRYPENENIHRLFHLQNCLGRKSLISQNFSKTFSPADMSQSQTVNSLEIFKKFFACRIVLAAGHRYRENENIHRLFHLQNSLSRKSSTTWKYSKTFHLQNSLSRKSSTTWKHSKTFSPAELSWTQIIDIPKTFKDFFACRIVLAAGHRYPEINQRLFHRQKYLSLKSSTTWKPSNTLSPAELSWTQIINIPKLFKDFLSPAELSQPQINETLKLFIDFFTSRIVLAANHQYPENIHRLFHLQNCLGRRSSIPRKCSKTFSLAEISKSRIINNLETFKDFFDCRIVLAADHRYSENTQRLLHRQKSLSRKLSIPRKHSQTFSRAKLSQPQIIDTPKMKTFIDFFTCRIVLDANH